MPGTMNQSCQVCFYFDKVNFVCRHDPPVINIINNKAVSSWPTVAVTDWCGEYQPRTPGQ